MTGLGAAEAALFKAYDLRGPAPRPLTPELAFRVGRAFAGMLDGGRRLGLARDMRRTSPALAAAFAAGAEAGGAEVVFYGLLATDALWFAVRHDRLDGGAVVTASHNPPGDNGIKLVERDAAPVFAENRLPEVRRRTAAAPGPTRALPTTPSLPVRDILPDYLDFLLHQIEGRRLPPLRAVLDAGNGMGGLAAEALFARIPGEFLPMDFEPDGDFPNRGGNPLDPANRVGLAERVRAEKADFGVLWDGDADRCAFVDGAGHFLAGDFTTALLAPAEIEAEPGAAVVYDRRSSRAVPDAIRQAGGRPAPGRVGHAYMKRKMRDEDARFGGELSGHFYFRAAGYADNALLPILRLIERLGKTGRSLGELAGDLRRRYHTLDEKSIAVADAGAALDRVREAFPGGDTDLEDGLTADFADDWRFTLRPSNTEPVLRLTVEAFRPGLVERREAEILSVLREGEAAASAAPEEAVRRAAVGD